MNIENSRDHYNNSSLTHVNIELLVDARCVENVMYALKRTLTPITPEPVFWAASDRVSEHTDDETDPDAPDVMLRELRAHLDARLDEIDQALRLLVDP